MELRVSGIVYNSFYGDLGGGELRMLEHLRLTRLPREEISVVLHESGPFRGCIESLGINTDQISWWPASRRPVRLVNERVVAWRLRRHFRRRQAGLVFCNTYNDLTMAGRVAKSLGIPVIWRSHADLFPFLEKYPPNRREEMVALVDSTATRILTTTEYDRALILNSGFASDKVHVVPLGVDLLAFKEAPSRRSRLRKEWRVPDHLPLIGFVSRMVPQKGHTVFFAALTDVLKRHPDVRVLVVGDANADGSDPDGFRMALRAYVNKLGLSHCVQFLGFQDDVPGIMSAIDIFVHASLKEPFGSVIVEAMAAGRPVIASRTLGPQEIIIDGSTGLLTPPGESPALATAMLRLLEAPGFAQTLGIKGRKHVEKLYDLSQTIELLDNHFMAMM